MNPNNFLILLVLFLASVWANEQCTAPRIDINEKIKHLSISVLTMDDVCMNERELIEYSKDQPLPAWQPRSFPELRPILGDYIKAESISNDSPFAPTLGSDCQHEGPVIRKATEAELALRPHFSECTKPLMIFIPFVSTYAEYFVRVPSFLRVLLRDGVIDRNISVVIATCRPGLQLTPWQKLLVMPYSNHKVRGWDSFASKNRPHSHAQADVGGVYQHCFKKVVATAFDSPAVSEAFNTAQETYTYYLERKLLPLFHLFNNTAPDNLKIFIEFRSPTPYNPHTDRIPPIQAFSIIDPKVQEIITSHKYNIKQSTNGNHCGNRSVYPGVRQILNLQEILDKCNAGGEWVQQMLSGTRYKTVECKAYSFSSNVLEGIAAVRQADVFLSLHGSGEANSMFMEQGKIKIQMRPKEFGTIHGYMSNGYWPRLCESINNIDLKLYCWFINFEEFEDFEPGIYERMGRPIRDSETRRDRHLWLKWDKLIHVLKEVLPVEDAAYRARWKNNTVAFTFFPKGKVVYSCLFCPWLREVAEGEATCDEVGRIHPPGWRQNPNVPPDHSCRPQCPMYLELMNP